MGVKNLGVFIILTSILILGLFYWYQFRPSQIRKKCSEISKEKAGEKLKWLGEETKDETYIKASREGKYQMDDYEFIYNQCLHDEGLK